MIDPSSPITNYKIVSDIRNEIASRLDIDALQKVLALHWKPYLENLHVCMTDATCYESHMREAIENYQCDQQRNPAKELQFVVKQQNCVSLRSWINSKNR